MMKGILEGKEIKYGGKVLGNKKLLAIGRRRPGCRSGHCGGFRQTGKKIQRSLK